MRLAITLLIITVLAIFVVNNVNAQVGSTGIIATTNKPVYQLGDKVIISGSVAKVVNNNPVTIMVINPIGNVYEVGQVSLSNNLFTHDFVLGDDASSGTYDVKIKYGDQSGKASFVVQVGQTQLIPVGAYAIKVRGNNTNLIKYSDVSISTVDNSFTVTVNASAISSGSVMQEFQIPKTIIDAPGSLLVVKIDGFISQCVQIETTSDRIIDCMIPVDATQLQIFGTRVIPEFGPIAMLILTIGVLATIFLSNKMKIN
ncbi:MAG: PEFG-CTERM sorting domain-containing protein [Nitrosopumilales archaeon]|nr:MAG: PEFG-CTERM sorting domain-containing protein [Nitrosopumilales archaeon]